MACRSTFYDTPDGRARELTIVAEMKTICDEFRRLMREHALTHNGPEGLDCLIIGKVFRWGQIRTHDALSVPQSPFDQAIVLHGSTSRRASPYQGPCPAPAICGCTKSSTMASG
jgi:hypothetical protein